MSDPGIHGQCSWQYGPKPIHWLCWLQDRGDAMPPFWEDLQFGVSAHVWELAWVQEAEFQMKLLANETRFILAVVSGDLVVSNRKKADIVADLEREGYDKMPVNKKVRVTITDYHSQLSRFPRGSHFFLLLQPLAACAYCQVAVLIKL